MGNVFLFPLVRARHTQKAICPVCPVIDLAEVRISDKRTTQIHTYKNMSPHIEILLTPSTVKEFVTCADGWAKKVIVV